MSRHAISLGTSEIDFLKETLHAQQELLQKLYNELDVERESSATAADEALSMILRLQGEKAAMEMEASQYKRIAEEKMFHAQETVETFQELIYQKEMQIASLEFQVQAYKFKLVSMGCDDLGGFEMQYPENLLSRRNGALAGETSDSFMRRGSSVPPPAHKPLSRRPSMEGIKSMQSSPKALQYTKDVETSFRRERTTGGDVNTYWEEIRKLDERVKELATIKNFNTIPKPEKVKAPSYGSPLCNPSPDSSPRKTDLLEYPDNDPSQPCGDSPTSVQDIFEVKEVPLCSNLHQEHTPRKKDKGKLVIDVETSRNEKLASIWEAIWKSDVKEKIDYEKKPLLSPTSNNNSPKPKDATDKFDWEKKPLIDWEKKSLLSPTSNNDSPRKEKFDWGKKSLMSPRNTEELFKLKEGKTPEKHSLLKHPTYNGVADFELQQFNRRLKQLEDDRFVLRGNEITVEPGDEQLVLLKEIRDKIDSMQTEITSWRNKKPPHQELPSIGCLREAMIHFWP